MKNIYPGRVICDMKNAAIIKNRIFLNLDKPVKRFLASDKADTPMTAEFYAEKDYEQLFLDFLSQATGSYDEQISLLIAELDSGADRVAQKLMLALYSPWQKNLLPKAIKTIANKSEEYPLMSDLLIKFCQQPVGSVDAVDDFGETALAKILKKDQQRKSPLLFLVKHGAKHCQLTSALQDSLIVNNSDIYNVAEDNTMDWISNCPQP
ncbi:Dot/Icm T4SS effector RavG [Legionella pneumophila]|uniref:Dot/Icm T4SS effector RavG n=1 Tax=Legionella pneumophila TaxID=446 RepID=UPI0012AAACFB|nr:Dot/Icm T4SS effector RavG [Legionella pneumophila]QGK65374.1 Dot/Icm T4SS effector RavG [Legionella pneumophila]